MIIKRLELKNFRNYKEQTIDFTPSINFIYGMNAQGKTNVLEALFFMGCARSHRTSKDMCLIKEDEGSFMLRVHVLYDDEIEKEIKISYDKETKKKDLYINGKKQQSIGELFGKMQMVFFSPEDLMMLKEGPAVRRRQIDIIMSQIKPAYFYELSRYHKVLAQKNNLLKEIKKKAKLIETLDIWSENLAASGAKVIIKRREFIKEIGEMARQKHLVISDGTETLGITYKTFFEINNGISENDISKKLFDKYMENREREILTGITFIGPHRDDIIFNINGMDTRNFASQGQQRSAVLSFKMAQLDYIFSATGERPVLLLDDVFSELDEKRKEYMYGNLADNQIYITGTQRDDIIKRRFEDINYLFVENGRIVKE